MTQFVTFQVADCLYGIDVTGVQEVLPPQPRTPTPLAPPTVAGLVNLRGQVVLAVDLRKRLALPPREDDEPMMVVVRVGSETVSLLVDRIGEVVTVGPESFAEPPETLPVALRALVRGAHRLPDRLLLVLDVDQAAA
ncbi:MAG: chemotaxis protein CheW [Cellulomonas sp. 73-92]|uniref:chemotaxis protein CheW n=1 Tax=Cellulomonas sp. 73-92 TaxID=1895740 RepID=UPI00092BB50E|nr:chemotaxis protein CheW [Cellulomonas sp. 73-92]OJV80685.1 MAG: chemotaxis protein CheW [Cellulomonas sp. 73-92]